MNSKSLSPSTSFASSWVQCLAIGAICAVTLGFPRQLGAQALYGSNGAGGGSASLLILNSANGSLLSTVGPLLDGTTGIAMTGLAFHPTSGVLYGVTGSGSVRGGRLWTISTSTAEATLIGTLGLGGNSLSDITFTSDGTLYGVGSGSSPNDLFEIDLLTGAATSVGPVNNITEGSGLAANSSNTLFLVQSWDSKLFTVSRTTGNSTFVADLSSVLFALTGRLPRFPAAAFSGTTLFAANMNRSGSRPAHLITINTATGAVTDLGQTVDALDAIAFQPTPNIAVEGSVGQRDLALRVSPNPSRGESVIMLTLPTMQSVRMTILDLSGRRVREVFSAPLTAGEHVFRWDGLDAAGRVAGAGVYFVTVTAGDQRVTTRALRIR